VVELLERGGRPDLLAIAERDTRLTGHGKERHGPCVFCGGTDRFWVRLEDNRWFCRRCTPQGGDAITYIMRRERVGYRQALAVLDGHALHEVPPRSAPAPAPLRPAAAWQAHAARLCARAQDCLYAPEGERALAWLHARGLADATIRGAGLGWCPRVPARLPEHLRRGISIPVYGVDGLLYGVWFRLPAARDARAQDKYRSLLDSRHALYGSLRGADTLLITEGYFDALLAAQELCGMAVDVATMNLCRPAGHWLRYLLGYRRILVCLDNDTAGEVGWRHWSWIGTARRCSLPAGTGKDITQAVVTYGLDLAGWLAEQVGTMEPPVPAPQAAPIVDAGPEEAVPHPGPDTVSIPAGEDRWLLHADERYF
jgi:hypothetical protein